MSTVKHFSVACAALAAQCFAASAIDLASQTPVGRWDNVTSFSINAAETQLVFTLLEANGLEKAYEVVRVEGGWASEKAISSINNYEQGAHIGGLSLTPDGLRLYFHANYRSGKGGFDIYYVDHTPNGWSDPQLVEGISTAQDEKFPSLTPGEQQMYFLRPMDAGDFFNKRQDPERMQMCRALCDEKGKWTKGEPSPVVLNAGYVEDATIVAGGLNVYYSSRTDKKEKSEILKATAECDNVWGKPSVQISDRQSFDFFSPILVGDNLYALHSSSKRREREGMIVKFDASGSAAAAKNLFSEEISIIDATTKKPLNAEVVLYDAISNSVIGRFSCSPNGKCLITAQRNNDMILSIRRKGHSVKDIKISASESKKRFLPEKIELTDKVQLVVNVTDSETSAAVEAKVVAVKTDKTVFRSQKANGKYVLELPLGDDYHIITTAANYKQADLNVGLKGDIVVNRVDRNMTLQPETKSFSLRIIDKETRQPLKAKAQIISTFRNQSINNNKIDLALRIGEKAQIELQAAGYASSSLEITASATTEDKVIELSKISAGFSQKIEGLSFVGSSALIAPNSAAALEKLANWLKTNPEISIEISAGSNLAAQRAANIAKYLVAVTGNSEQIKASSTPSEDNAAKYTVLSINE